MRDMSKRPATPALDMLYDALFQDLPQPVALEEWMQTGTETLFPDSPALPEQMLTFGRTALQELAALDLPDLLKKPRSNVELIRVRRREFLAARDAVILSSGNYLDCRKGQPLLQLCRQLGRVADTDGQASDPVKLATSAFNDLGKSLEFAQNLHPIKPKNIRRNANALIDTRPLNVMYSQSPTTRQTLKDYSRYSLDKLHDARIDFRRVAHAGLISAICEPTIQRNFSAARAFRLSNLYGVSREHMAKNRQKLKSTG